MNVGKLDLPARLECQECGWVIHSNIPNIVTTAIIDGQMTLRIDIIDRRTCEMCNLTTNYKIITDEQG